MLSLPHSALALERGLQEKRNFQEGTSQSWLQFLLFCKGSGKKSASSETQAAASMPLWRRLESTFIRYCFYGVLTKPAEGLMGDLEKLKKKKIWNVIMQHGQFHALPWRPLHLYQDTLKIIRPLKEGLLGRAVWKTGVAIWDIHQQIKEQLNGYHPKILAFSVKESVQNGLTGNCWWQVHMPLRI